MFLTVFTSFQRGLEHDLCRKNVPRILIEIRENMKLRESIKISWDLLYTYGITYYPAHEKNQEIWKTGMNFAGRDIILLIKI
jgi:hypothetical protein